MATATNTLIQMVRRYVRDWPDWDATTASMGSLDTSVSVADSSRYYKNETIEIDQEDMIVRAIPDGTTLTVARGAYGSTAATHSSGADVVMKPAWTAVQILDALNAAIQATYPYVYQEVMDTSTTIATNTYEYAVPNMPGTYGGDTIPMQRIRAIDILDPGATNLPYVPLSGWLLRRDITAPMIKLTYLENPGATLRIRGYGPFPDIDFGGSLHDAFPRNLVQALVEYAASVLLMSGEAGRLRADAQLMDTREAAQRPGSSLNAANAAEARFTRRLSNNAMPPMQGRLVIQS